MDTAKKQELTNPRDKANPLSILTFWWTVDLFKKGYSKVLVEEDLYQPMKEDASQYLGDILQTQWEKQLERAKKKKKPPKILPALFKTFAFDYILLGVMAVTTEGFRLGQPLALGKLLSYFRPGSTMEREEALIYAALMVIFQALNSLIANHYTLGAFHVGMRVRAACCSLVYRKSLKLSRTALGETAAGKVVNLLSNDVSRFDMVSIFLHFMWTSPLQAILIAYLLYLEAGAAGFVGMAVVFVVVPLQSYTGHLSSKFRMQTAFKTDERVRLMDEIVSGIQVIKMYAWERPFAKMIELARRLEIKVVRKTSMVRGLYMTFMLCTTRIALFCTLLVYVVLGNKLAAERVFVMASYFSILAHTMSGMFVRGFAEIAEALVSCKRIEDFLLKDEFHPQESLPSVNGSDKPAAPSEPVVLKHATARWLPTHTDDTLADVNLVAKQGTLTTVIGQVGAGKSSLLQAIIRELPISSGSCVVNGKLSYACQESWVFSASVRQNITFGLPYDKKRYLKVVHVCALERDFQQLPQGDMTIVGERGSSLSGGQKARVNLARAVYNDADIYLLDDPLSAVDTHVGKHLFEECINGFLKDKTRILVTHQLQYLKDSDLVVIMNNGAIEMQGSFQDLNSQVDYAHLLKESEDEEAADLAADGDFDQTPIRNIVRQISVQSRTSSEKLNKTEEESKKPAPDMTEQSSKGKVHGSVYVGYFASGTNVFVFFIIMVMFTLTQIVASGIDYWVSYWTTKEELRSYLESNNATSLLTVNDTLLEAQLNDTFRDVVEATTDLMSTDEYLYIYCGLVVGLFVIALSRSLAFVNMCMSCSQQLHNGMFASIIRTRMRFFDTNPSGRILNRFSKDIGSIDELLPKALLDATQMIMMMTGALIVACTVNYLFLVPIFVLSIVFWFVRVVYLKTSKNVKRLEGIAKSPVFTHLSATMQGLTTIRAYGAQEILRQEFDRHQDLHTSAWWMFVSCSTAFGFSLDVLCVIYICLVTFSFLTLGEDVFGGQVGLAITQSMALSGMMQWGMRQSAEVANQMMSVERVLEYSELEEEPGLEVGPVKPPPDWPKEGQVVFEDASMRYVEGDPPVLKELNIVILPTEKVGIVGRTGAGKSSLISALFRLARVEGSIRIDGIETKDIALQTLRSKISIIPQDPVLFSGTLRKNLDPFEEFPDSVLWKALEEVELREGLHDTLGLDTRVAEGGSNFSVGQRQLVCLARAILRNNKILMLDEATANVDPHTDALIQKTIRMKFVDCTVLTVAHRLNTIMDSDKVLVMEQGREVEYDHPHLLLQNRKGYFHKMVDETGKAMAEQLAKVAEEAYLSKTDEL